MRAFNIQNYCEGSGLTTTMISKIVPKLPDDYQPLVKALVEENNVPLCIRRIAKQNHVF